MVPEYIRIIERPKNINVQAAKKDNVYLVIQRIGCKYDNGRRLHVNGSVIGHIIDGVYVEKDKDVKHLSTRTPHMLKYGAVSL